MYVSEIYFGLDHLKVTNINLVPAYGKISKSISYLLSCNTPLIQELGGRGRRIKASQTYIVSYTIARAAQ